LLCLEQDEKPFQERIYKSLTLQYVNLIKRFSMKAPVVLFFLLICFNAFDQETVEVKTEGTEVYEVFYKLKKKPYSKHGSYKVYRTSDNLLLVEGNYDMGKKSGIWTYYNSEGVVREKMDETTGKLTFYNPDADTVTTIIRVNGNTERVKLDWPVEYAEGESAMWKTIQTNIEYPEIAREEGISGEILISFFVGTDGIAREHAVLKGVAPILDEEALRVVKLLSDKWQPAKYKGEPVEALHVMSIRFTIA
jgi:protein TonB